MSTPNLQEAQGTYGRDTTFTKKRATLAGGAVTLTSDLSGTLCQFSTAAGYTYILPVPTLNTVGTWFEFVSTITNTSVVCKVITDAATTFLVGGVYSSTIAATPSATLGPKAFSFDGTTHRACNLGGTDTTSGGLVGSRFRVTLINLTQWLIEGDILAAGTIVTPASTT